MSIGEDIEERPGWLYPLILFAITAVIGAGFLWVYLGPDIEDLTGARIRPTAAADSARVVIAGRIFSIPVNYVRVPAARSGGQMDEIELQAILPDLHGFASGDEDALKDVSRVSPVVSIILRAGAPELTARERFRRIYARNADPDREPFAYAGFTVTPMAGTSGYAGQQAFIREGKDDLVVILCDSDDATHNIGGLCQREFAHEPGMTVIVGFRGGHLDEWDNLDSRVMALLDALETPQAAQ